MSKSLFRVATEPALHLPSAGIRSPATECKRVPLPSGRRNDGVRVAEMHLFVLHGGQRTRLGLSREPLTKPDLPLAGMKPSELRCVKSFDSERYQSVTGMAYPPAAHRTQVCGSCSRGWHDLFSLTLTIQGTGAWPRHPCAPDEHAAEPARAGRASSASSRATLLIGDAEVNASVHATRGRKASSPGGSVVARRQRRAGRRRPGGCRRVPRVPTAGGPWAPPHRRAASSGGVAGCTAEGRGRAMETGRSSAKGTNGSPQRVIPPALSRRSSVSSRPRGPAAPKPGNGAFAADSSGLDVPGRGKTLSLAHR
jgi:hypothetical protein